MKRKKILVILNNFIKKNTFLYELFNESKQLDEIIFDKSTYLFDIKEKILNNNDFEVIFLRMNEKLNLNELKLNDYNKIFYYNMRFFPKNFNSVYFLIQKTLELPFPIKILDNKSKDLVLFIDEAKDFTLNPKFGVEEGYKIMIQNIIEHSTNFKTLNEDIFIDLFENENILEIFISGGQLRSFNSLTSKNGYFIKSSTEKEKLKKEYEFFLHVPNSIKYFFPQLGEFRELKDKSEYEIEKIPMLDIAKLLINNMLNLIDLKTILERVKEFFKNTEKIEIKDDKYKEDMKEIFLNKLKLRINKIKELPIYEKLNLISRLKGYESIEAFSDSLMKEIEIKINKLKDNSLYYIHGDLFFSNILYDKVKKYIKFIDPRGFDKYKGLPIYYDLAKLSHSFIGLYDILVYELYEIVLENGEPFIYYKINKILRQQMEEAFKEFLTSLNVDIQFVRMLESSLFLSMIPLHSENTNRMIAQFITSIEIFKENK